MVGRVGQKLVITAGFCCHPAPRVDWVVGDTTLIKEDSSRINFSTKPEVDSCYSTTLTFNQLRTSDSGVVALEVANTEGGQRRVIIVEVINEELEEEMEPTEEELAEIEVMGVVAGEVMLRLEEDMVRKELVEMVNKEEAEAPMEVIASLWVGGIAILALLSLVTLQASVFETY